MPINLQTGHEYGGSTPISPTRETGGIGNDDNGMPPQERPRSNSPQPSGGALRGLAAIPELTQQIARHTDHRTTIAFAQALGATRGALEPEHAAAAFERDASTIKTSQAFNDALAGLAGIPENWRDKPLFALGARIPHLPEDRRQADIRAWLDAAHRQPHRSTSLDSLMLNLGRAAAGGPADMRRAINGKVVDPETGDLISQGALARRERFRRQAAN